MGKLNISRQTVYLDFYFFVTITLGNVSLNVPFHEIKLHSFKFVEMVALVLLAYCIVMVLQLSFVAFHK